MTKFSITKSNSIHTTADFSDAFASGSNSADTLTVLAGAHLMTDGTSATAAVLDDSFAWNVKVDGTISSQKFNGLWLAVGNDDMSQLTIGTEGVIFGGFNGVFAQSAVTIKNHGTIDGGSAGVEVYGNEKHKLINDGSISGAYSFLNADGVSDDLVKNFGVMTGSIDLGSGDDRLINTGELKGVLQQRLLALDGGDDVLVNHGAIRLDIVDTDGSDKITNRGLIDGAVDLSAGDDVFTNFTKAGGKTVSGAVTGQIRLGDGDDHLYGGDKVEDFRDGGGSDVVNFRGGADVYRAVHNAQIDGLDHINGGKGIDTYDASAAVDPIYINLDKVNHDLPFGTGYAVVEAGTAIGSDVAGNSLDRIRNVENIFGGIQGDIIYGSAKANFIDGRDDTDDLHGMGGKDHLIGGGSLDHLTGGAGMDLLTGGEGTDMFVFNSIRDSGTKVATRDVITDFEDGDNIVLTRIDAIKGTSTDDAFDFIGTDTAFTGQAGELRAYRTAKGQVIEGDVDGDAIADFSIGLGVGTNLVLKISDFEL